MDYIRRVVLLPVSHIIILFLPLAFGAGCYGACDRYLAGACENRNSVVCHRAMQGVVGMSENECRLEKESLDSLKNLREKLEEAE